MGIEEQACHSLHVHILLWIKEINELRIALCSGISTVQQQQKAKLLIAQYFDNVASCSLVYFPDSKMYRSVLITSAIVIGCKGDNFKQCKIKNYEIRGIVHTMHKIRTDI